ncbi:MAG: ABC transporter permease [Gemmatimonadales bacterium]
MDTFVQDLRYAVRQLAKSPGFTTVAVLTLALGIGANTAIFSVVNRLLFNPLPFLEQPDRLVAVWETDPRGNDHSEASPANFRDWKRQARSFDHMVAHIWWTANLTGGDRPERVQGFLVSPDYFTTLGIRPLLGRGFVAGEGEPGRDRVVVLSHGIWQRRFGGDPRIVGQAIPINGIPRMVVGVLPPDVRYPAAAELWGPLSLEAEEWEIRIAHFLLVTGRLAPGVTVTQAHDELAGIARGLATEYPASNTDQGTYVRSLIPDVTRQLEPILLSLFVAVGFVLLIACANVANLLLARGATRGRELAVRATLGASRPRLTRQLLTESVVLALAGGGIGVLVAIWGVGALVALVPLGQQPYLNGFNRVAVDGPVLLFTLGLSLATAFGFGLAPALRASRTDLQAALQEEGRAAGSRPRHRLRRALIAAEVALALLLLVGAGLTLRSFRHLLDTSPGFDVDGIALTNVSLPGSKYSDDVAVAGFYRHLLDQVAGIPGVHASGAVNITPLCRCNQTTSFEIEGAPPFAPGEGPDVGWRVVTPGYFAALGVPLREGRAFDAADNAATRRVAIVNQALARRYFPDGAIGRRLLLTGDSSPIEIVGLLSDLRHDGPARLPQPEVYLPAAQIAAREMVLVARTTYPAGVLPALRAEVQRLDPDQPVFDQRTMRDVFDLVVGPHRLALRLLAALGALALALAAVGIYGVLGQLVAERTREIGIRVALGSDPPAVRRLVLRQGMVPVAWGVAIGLLAALGLTRALASQLVGVSPAEPVTLAIVALLLGTVALAACYVPVRRATSVDPMVALRND